MKRPKPSLNILPTLRHLLAPALLLLLLCTALPVLAPVARAQEAAANESTTASSTPTDANPAPVEKKLTLMGMYKTGGWTMHILLLAWIVLISLVIYNATMLRPAKVLGLPTLEMINQAIDRMEFDKIPALCAPSPGLLTNMVRAGFSRVGQEVSLSSIQSGMEEAAPEEIQKAMTTVSYLSTIGVVAPMVGLLGTVSGMIKAFRAMALGGMGRPELLADNISEALITTASGLIVGIPAMIAYYFFKYKLAGLSATAARLGGDIVERTKNVMKGYAASQAAAQPVYAQEFVEQPVTDPQEPATE